jgi:hypothetical protein
LELGNSLLVLMSDAPASLALVTIILHELADPTQVDMTLAYYLEPLLWQRSDPGISEALQHLFEQEDALLDNTQPASPPTYFSQARTLIIRQGLSPDRVHVEAHWRQPDLLSYRKTQLTNGTYSAVIIVRHHYDMLFGLLGVTLRQVLIPFGHQVHVHILDLSIET